MAEGAPAMAGQRGGGSPARVRWATPGATGYGKRRKREQGIKTCSPKPGIEQRRRAEASTSGLGGGDGVVVTDGVDAGALRAPGIHGQLRGVPARASRSSGWSGNHWRQGNAAAQRLTGGDVGSKSRRRAWRKLGAEASRSATGSWRCCGAVSSGPGYGGAARPRRSRGSARRGKARQAELGFAGRRVGWMGAGGSVGC